jgi:phenylacetate-coenzyme A ligase PaaK-like adenylate-forming protein
MSILQTVRFSLLTARLGEVARWKPERIEKLQRRRLRRLVRFAAQRSPFYRERFRGVDLDNEFRIEQLPSVTKAEVMANFDDVVTDPRLRRADAERFIEDPDNLGRWLLGRYAVSHTSGSQGAPLLIVQDRTCLEVLFALMSARSNSLGRPGVVEAVRRIVSPARIAIVTGERGFFPSGAAFEFMPELVGPYVNVLRLSSMQSDLIARLNQFQPEILVAYASVLEALALQADRLRLSRLRQIANSSEQLTARAAARIRKAFGVTLLDHYGMGECLFLSDGCPTDGGAHINADWAILEVVDENNQPVPPGQTGKKVLVTNLANRIQPLIRYEITDRIALAAHPCGCGSRLPRIESIEGRAAELFWVPEGNEFRIISGVLFHNAADALRDISEWQAIQQERNRIEVRLQLTAGASLAPDAATRLYLMHLTRLGIPRNVDVDVRIVPLLSPDLETGKFRRMIDLIGPPTAVLGRVGYPNLGRKILQRAYCKRRNRRYISYMIIMVVKSAVGGFPALFAAQRGVAAMSSFPTNGSKEPTVASATQDDVVLEHIRAALRGLQFGAVTIVVQNGRIVQIERHEKTRLIHTH